LKVGYLKGIAILRYKIVLLYNYSEANVKNNFALYAQELLKESAIYSKGYITLASSNLESDWNSAAKETMKHAQESISAYLYNYLRAVGAI